MFSSDECSGLRVAGPWIRNSSSGYVSIKTYTNNIFAAYFTKYLPTHTFEQEMYILKVMNVGTFFF